MTAMRGGGAEGAARAAGARLTSSRMSTKKRLLWRLALTTDREVALPALRLSVRTGIPDFLPCQSLCF